MPSKFFLLLTALSLTVTAADARMAKQKEAVPATPAPVVKRPDDPGCGACRQQAASLFARGEAENAEKLLREWSPKCPNSAQLHLLLSSVLISQGKHDDAEKESALATTIAPSMLAAHLQHAVSLQALGKKMQASEEFEKATEIDPTSYESWTALASLYRELHEDDKATDAMAKAADLDPHSKAQRMSILNNLKRAGKFAEAKIELKRLLAAPTTTPEFAEDLAKEGLLIGAYAEAIEAAGKSLGAHPSAVAPRITSALAHYCSHNYEGVIADADKILEMEPHNVDALALKSMGQVKANQIEQAEATLKEAGPESTSTILWLSKGSIDSARSNYTAAEEALRACLDYDQGNNAMQGIPHSLARLALAEVYQKQNKPALVTEQIHALQRDKRFDLEAMHIGH